MHLTNIICLLYEVKKEMVLLTKEKSCVDCRYYLGREYVCMKLWRTACIRDEWVAAKECKDFVEGIYDEDLIEKEY